MSQARTRYAQRIPTTFFALELVMKRIVPFGREHRYSAPFTVDEGQRIGLLLVRTDGTSSSGPATAELQMKSYDDPSNPNDNNLWTLVKTLDSEYPYHEIVGTDEQLQYRVSVNASSYAAVDSSGDAGGMSRTKRTPVSLVQPNFNDPNKALVFKVVSGAGPGGTLGVYDSLLPATGPGEFGAIVGDKPNLNNFGNPPGALVFISLIYDPAGPTASLVFHQDIGDGTSQIDWASLVNTGTGLRIYTECGYGQNSSGSYGFTLFDGTGEVDIDCVVTATSLTVPFPFDGNSELNGFDPLQFFAVGSSFFVDFTPQGKSPSTFALGATTGQFTLDQNDVPARVSAWPFDSNDEYVSISAVEGNVVIPISALELHQSNPVETLYAPGVYEWRRSCNAGPGVYLNTGWNAP